MNNKKQIHDIRKAAKALKDEIKKGSAIREGKLKILKAQIRDLFVAIDQKDPITIPGRINEN